MHFKLVKGQGQIVLFLMEIRKNISPYKKAFSIGYKENRLILLFFTIMWSPVKPSLSLLIVGRKSKIKD